MREVKANKIFWGIFLLLAAVFLVVSQMGLVEGVGVLSILFAIFWVAQFIEGLVKRSFGRMLFSLAFLCIIFDEQLGIEAITPWTVLGAALLGTIGLNMIFRKRWHKQFHYETNWCHGGKKYSGTGAAFVDGEAEILEEESQERQSSFGAQAEGDSQGSAQANRTGDSRFFFETSFGAAAKFINTNNFEFASLECSFGALKVYFDNAVIQNGKAAIDVDVSFGSVELYIPRSWNLVDETSAAFGSVKEKNRNRPAGTTSVTLTGDVSFGGVEIVYI